MKNVMRKGLTMEWKMLANDEIFLTQVGNQRHASYTQNEIMLYKKSSAQDASNQN